MCEHEQSTHYDFTDINKPSPELYKHNRSLRNRNMLNPTHLQKTAKYKSQFKAKPFNHLSIKNFLHQNQFQHIKKAVSKQKFRRYDSDLFQFSQTENLYLAKDKTINNFCDFFSSPQLVSWIAEITATKLLPKVDISAFLYKKNDYLLPHDDLIEEKTTTRKIAYIFYLSTLNKNDGGTLDLYKQKKVAKSFMPQANTLMIFKVSSVSFHQVAEVLKNLKRYSITGWFHGD